MNNSVCPKSLYGVRHAMACCLAFAGMGCAGVADEPTEDSQELELTASPNAAADRLVVARTPATQTSSPTLPGLGSQAEQTPERVTRTAGIDWSTVGNAAVASDFLGTTNNVAFQIKVAGQRALLIQPGQTPQHAPNVISGAATNSSMASNSGATIGGGGNNLVENSYGTIAGGRANWIGSSASTIGGGESNDVSAGQSVIGGGFENVIDAFQSTIAGGQSNWIQSTGHHGTIGGGEQNNVQGGWATVGGGQSNSASGFHSTVPGGRLNWAGGGYSFAAGHRAKAPHRGCFVWGDSLDADVSCGAADVFVARASGGFYLSTNNAFSHAAYYTNSSTSWQYVSDRNSKRDFGRVDTTDVLQRLTALPMSTWTFKTDSTRTRHMGLMAQDFHAAFGLGESERSIDTGDIIGVSVAAIQGLHREITDLKASKAAAQQERQKLVQEQIELSQRMKRLEETVTRLTAARTEPQSSGVVGSWLGVAAFACAAAMIVTRRRREHEVT